MKYTVKKVTMYRVFCPYCRDRFTYDTELDARVGSCKAHESMHQRPKCTNLQ